jgi:hypothetical protein
VLLAFGGLFYWVLHQHNQSQQAVNGGRSGRRGAISGPVPVTYATATKGSLGVYQTPLARSRPSIPTPSRPR